MKNKGTVVEFPSVQDTAPWLPQAGSGQTSGLGCWRGEMPCSLFTLRGVGLNWLPGEWTQACLCWDVLKCTSSQWVSWVLWGQSRGVGAQPPRVVGVQVPMQGWYRSHSTYPGHNPEISSRDAHQQKSRGTFWALQTAPEDLYSFSSLKSWAFACLTHGKN